MTEENLDHNPFAALFPSVADAQQFAVNYKAQLGIQDADHSQRTQTATAPEGETKADHPTNTTSDLGLLAQEKLSHSNIIERIFLITLDKDVGRAGRPTRCVFLQELHQGLKGQDWLDEENIEQAVFERLMLPSPGDHVIPTLGNLPDPAAASAAGESTLLYYLAQAYARAQHELQNAIEDSVDVVRKCIETVISNGRMCVQHPEIFADLDVTSQFVSIICDEYANRDYDQHQEFLERVCNDVVVHEEEGSLSGTLTSVLEALHNKLNKDASLGQSGAFNCINALMFFTRSPHLGEILMDKIKPKDPSNGRSFENTLLGAALSVSCIVKNEAGPYEFFDKPSRKPKREHDVMEANIHHMTGQLNEQVFQLVYALLKCDANVKHKMLDWLGSCMEANAGKAKIWSTHLPALLTQMYCTDGFFMNLCAVLLRLCKPFSEPRSHKLLKVQPTYCMATAGSPEERRRRNVHMTSLSEETCLVPPVEAENERLPVEDSYNFITECFFMTHRCINLGLHVVLERLMKLNQDLVRTQSLYHDVVRQGGETSNTGRRIQEEMEKGMTLFLCMKAALTEPLLLELCVDFYTATATYLCEMATSRDHSAFQGITFPLSDDVPPAMANIPEFTADNIIDFMLFLKRFQDSVLEANGEKLSHLMTFVLVFMGSPERMKNPHLRARMAEALESLMPPKQQSETSLVMAHYHRQRLFHQHPLISHLSCTLLHVFVSIEMTGQGVEFEQKFNYRRPMYAILEYIWDIEVHRDAIKVLAEHAEEHIEDTNSPLFLRFINLLINDAIFLLDEAIQYMTQIKEKQEARERGEWESLEAPQRQEQEALFRQLGMLARFHNIMGNDTIHSLEIITQEIKNIFCHNAIVDRIAAMLNYFLVHLVGPKMKNLKVKDFDEYSFKPQETVSHICQLYLNLAESDEFCLAVSRDGRSYSRDLFVQAEKVLYKINKPSEMIMHFSEVSAKIKALATRQQEEDEALEAAPDDFLDPLLGTFMHDPVLLPTSGQTVDRTTIARHILSDQFDPFNRAPLTMEMVVPNTELKERIDQWKRDNNISS